MFEIRAERFCFENADGILHKGSPRELDFLKKENSLGKPIDINCPEISFLSYCSDEFMIPMNKKDKFSKKTKRFDGYT